MASQHKINKATGPGAIVIYHNVLVRIWEQQKMPEDFCDALIVALYKNKDSKADWETAGEFLSCQDLCIASSWTESCCVWIPPRM